VLCPQDISAAPWQVFPVLLPREEAAIRLVENAADAGVEIRRSYRPSLSRWPDTHCFANCPIAEDLSNRMCALPVRPLNSSPGASDLAKLVLQLADQTLSEFADDDVNGALSKN